MPTVAATPTAHIHLDAEGRAWIDDTNVKVIEVVLDKLGWGMEPNQIHSEYPDLSLAQIHAALSYYYDHQQEFDAEIRRQTEEVERLRKEAGESPIVKKLRERSLLA